MARLDVPCFPYRGKPLTASLVVEEEAGTGQFVRCPVRQRLYRLTAEECIRQALIWFLQEGCNRAATFKEYIRFGVEERSLDVAGFFTGIPLDEQFRPSITVVILETKRREEELSGHTDQLENYMKRDRCRAGMLFNGRQAMWVSLADDFKQPRWETLTDLHMAEEWIDRAGIEARASLAAYREAFDAAGRGDFNALVKLVCVFGNDLELVFALSVRSKDGYSRLVNASILKVISPNLLTYYAYGVSSRHPQQLSPPDFCRLLSIRPGGW